MHCKCLKSINYKQISSCLQSILFQGSKHFHSVNGNQHSWSVLKNLYQKQMKSAQKNYACFLLNLTDDSFKHFEKHLFIWSESSLKVAVDGSANCLAKKKMLHTADVVCGDFDSVDPKLINQLKIPASATKLLTSKGGDDGKPTTMPQVIETPAQNETDFTKAIRVAMSKRPDINFFFALYHSDGSRIDHLFGMVNTLCTLKKNIILVNIKSNTVSWLLAPGNHTIEKQPGRELCSLVPFIGPTEVTTQGLEYNIKPSINLCFGGLISTSNICLKDSENIIIDTNRELLWSIDVCNLEFKPT